MRRPTLLVCAAALVLPVVTAGSSAGETAPPAPSVRSLPAIVRPSPFAPKVVYPASGLAFEASAYPDVRVYIKWDYDGDPDKVLGFRICWWKEGSTCQTSGPFHGGMSATSRKAKITFPVVADGLRWKWKIGTALKTGAEPVWGPEQSITIYPKLDTPTLLLPASGASFAIPGTLTATWKDMRNVDFYLYCNQKQGFNLSQWACPDAPGYVNQDIFVDKVVKPAEARGYPPNNYWEIVRFQQTSSVRQWGVAACRVVQEQSENDGGQPPVAATHCTHSELRTLNVSITN